MGLYSSFYASLSGLSANAGSLNVIGNNLANLNTIGFKQSSGTFQDLFNASLGAIGTQGNGNPIQIGLGSRLAAITQNFGQGSFQSTSNVTDMAISGMGFFMLQLAGNQGQSTLPAQVEAFGIAGGIGQGMRKLFMSHPPLAERIAALRAGG